MKSINTFFSLFYSITIAIRELKLGESFDTYYLADWMIEISLVIDYTKQEKINFVEYIDLRYFKKLLNNNFFLCFQIGIF